jgi:hypothetical protein
MAAVLEKRGEGIRSAGRAGRALSMLREPETSGLRLTRTAVSGRVDEVEPVRELLWTGSSSPSSVGRRMENSDSEWTLDAADPVRPAGWSVA